MSIGRNLTGRDRVEERLMKEREEEELNRRLSGQLSVRDVFPLRDEGVTGVECPVEAVDDHVIILRGESNLKVGSLHMTERTGQKTRPFIGEIRSVGPGAPQYLHPGQEVIYHEYGQTTIYPYGIEYTACRSRDIICILKGDPIKNEQGEKTEGSGSLDERDPTETEDQES